jgi:cell wall-associated NlpC family hydrolase
VKNKPQQVHHRETIKTIHIHTTTTSFLLVARTALQRELVAHPNETRVEQDFADIRGQLQTGDLVFFSGIALASRITKFYTRSRWSHVAMVLCSDDIDMVCLMFDVWDAFQSDNV